MIKTSRVCLIQLIYCYFITNYEKLMIAMWRDMKFKCYIYIYMKLNLQKYNDLLLKCFFTLITNYESSGLLYREMWCLSAIYIRHSIFKNTLILSYSYKKLWKERIAICGDLSHDIWSAIYRIQFPELERFCLKGFKSLD